MKNNLNNFYFLLFIFLSSHVTIKAQCWKKISVGTRHVLALRSDGTMWEWGINASFIPIQIGADTNWTFISNGSKHHLAMKNDSTIWLWGENLTGQIGNGTYLSVGTPTQIGSDHWKHASAGGGSTLAIK